MKKRIQFFDILIILTMAILLFRQAHTSMDVVRYECYAMTFLYGSAVFAEPGFDKCNFVLDHQKPHQGPFYYLPQEYPLLSVIPFSLGRTYSFIGYAESFKLWMIIAAMYAYLLLLFYRSRTSAVVFVLYLVVGSLVTAAGRFDIVPALLSLTALVLADKKRWNWAYAVLAGAVLMKLYPLVLFPLFFIAQQKEINGARFMKQRYAASSLFIGICGAVLGLSYLLNVEGTLQPLMYFQDRPFQIETIWASVLWLIQPLSNPLSLNFEFGSINIISPLAAQLKLVSTGIIVIGFSSICWLLYQKKLTLSLACTMMLLLLLVDGKVFSAQYIMWVTPFIAYVGKANYRWVIPWLSVCVLSTWIYPYIYPTIGSVAKDSFFFLILTIRNSILVFFFVTLLFYYAFYPTQRQLTKLSDVASNKVRKIPHTT